MVEFNDDASPEIEALMGKGKWQLDRIPEEEVAQVFADAGIKIHFGGHMHINDTGIRKTAKGNTIVNVQTPSLAAYIPAYKLLTIKNNNELEIETIVINDVLRYNELFDLYKEEYKYLVSKNTKDIWNDAILQTKSYHGFTDFHLKELVRLRFLPDDWPLEFRTFLSDISGYDLLMLCNMKSNTPFNDLIDDKKKFRKEWETSKVEVNRQLKEHHLKINDLSKWKGIDMITDFYRIRSADRLAINDIGTERIKQYELLIQSFTDSYNTVITDANRIKLGLFFTIFNKFLNGAPAGHFEVNLKSGEVKNLDIKKGHQR
jgi:hypothetical protein